MKRKVAFATAVGAVALALTAVVAGCGGSGDSNGVASLANTGQTTTSGSSRSGGVTPKERREAELEFAKCMREHGVDMPDPTNGRFELKVKPGDQKKAEEAQMACRKILEDVAPPISEEQQARQREAALEYAKCMREHGIEMADPEFKEGGGMTMRVPEGMQEDDPKFKEAQKACEPILRAVRPGKSAGGQEESS